MWPAAYLWALCSATKRQGRQEPGERPSSQSEALKTAAPSEGMAEDQVSADDVSAPDAREPGAATRARDGRVSSRVRLLALELVIVFVGVWAALAAEAWRDRREQDRRAVRITSAIQADLEDLTTWYRTWRDSVGAEYETWRSARAAGERLPPYYIRIPGSERGGLIGWQVALASNALDVLEPELVFEIGRVSRELDGKGERFARYMALTEVLVFPQLSKTPEEFYEPRTSNLKPEYAAHMKLLDEVLMEMDIGMRWAAELSHRLSESVAGR